MEGSLAFPSFLRRPESPHSYLIGQSEAAWPYLITRVWKMSFRGCKPSPNKAVAFLSTRNSGQPDGLPVILPRIKSWKWVLVPSLAIASCVTLNCNSTKPSSQEQSQELDWTIWKFTFNYNIWVLGLCVQMANTEFIKEIRCVGERACARRCQSSQHGGMCL